MKSLGKSTNKKAVIVILAFFIVLTLVSGSLAVYTASIDDIDEEFSAAKFVVRADAETLSQRGIVNIAPGDSYDVNFTVRNFEGVYISETDMKLVLQIEIDGELDPVSITLFDGERKLGTVKGKGTIDYDSIGSVFQKNKAQDKTYTLRIEWPDGAPEYDSLYIGKGASYVIRVTGIQCGGAELEKKAIENAKEIQAATLRAAEKDTQGLFTGGFTGIDSTATEIAGIRRNLIVPELSYDIENTWHVEHRRSGKQDVFDVYVAVTAMDGALRVAWWTECIKLSPDGTVTKGYVSAKFQKDENGVSYRYIDPRTFTTDIEKIDKDRLY